MEKREAMGVLAWLCLMAYILGGLYLWANRTMPYDPDRGVEVSNAR